ncbi:hypothetical protein CASFOL_002410 [Castilleja foliolosa]|uniref:Uncharacterized protein n=1 Tax=Castilleja foliolosa TaxID=1961234 RepID=A0ABD3EI59_9LAMI
MASFDRMNHRMTTNRMFPGLHSMASFDRMSHRMDTSRLILSNTSKATHCCKNQEEEHPNTPHNLPKFILYHTHKVFDKLPEPNFQVFTPNYEQCLQEVIDAKEREGNEATSHNNTGFHFSCLNEEEVAIFKSLEPRHVTPPKWFDLNLHEQDARLNRRYGSVITGYIDSLSAGVLARNKSPGFREIMLEFITTFKEGVTGNLTYRLKGVEYELKENEVTRVLGIDGHGRVGEYDEDYDLGNFWNYLTGGNPGSFERLKASRIHDDEVYVAYKFLAHVILNKDEASIISKSELYALWCMMNGKTVRLISLISASLIYIIKSRTKKSPAYLAFGSLITMIARFHYIDLDDDNAEYPSEEFEVTGRKVGNEWRTIPQNREELLPDSGLEDDEDEEDEDAFDEGARPRRRVAHEPAYMEVDVRELEEDDEDDADYEEEEEADYEEPNGWRAAEARMNQRYEAWSNENRVFQEEARSRHEELIRRDDENRVRQEVRHKELMDALARWNTGGQGGPPPS